MTRRFIGGTRHHGLRRSNSVFDQRRRCWKARKLFGCIFVEKKICAFCDAPHHFLTGGKARLGKAQDQIHPPHNRRTKTINVNWQNVRDSRDGLQETSQTGSCPCRAARRSECWRLFRRPFQPPPRCAQQDRSKVRDARSHFRRRTRAAVCQVADRECGWAPFDFVKAFSQRRRIDAVRRGGYRAGRDVGDPARRDP